ncbi:hypothetical protein G6L86_20160 [Agrobacterium tumefaciens]|uniref:hypothetical protein n=1 Tax=Agrobacterium tumefaciens TaxID=358 RepID=UPI0015721B42|nr:hypothetical protein [Agrobacterium tumefaciens]NSX87926.1 hypothetical protein [Agrobacterium tumefaciens]
MTDLEIRIELLSILHRLPGFADELGAIFASHGVEGGRVALGNIAVCMANDLADRLNDLADLLKAEMENATEIDLLIDDAAAPPKFH